MNPHIGVPFLTILCFNFNWMFIETGIAPSAHDALGWGPVETSYVFGAMSVLVFFGMTVVHRLSKLGFSDYKLLNSGLAVNAVGFLGLYFSWYRSVEVWKFVTPVLINAISFPFLGAPNRSLFSHAVDGYSVLRGYEGTMQALLSMSASIGGFSAPSIVAHYCLRTPEEVDASQDRREFNMFALVAPALGVLILVSTYLAGSPSASKVSNKDEETALEHTPLTDHQPAKQKSCPRELAKRASDRGMCESAMTIIAMDDFDEE